MKDFYLVMKEKVELGQYRLEDMLSDLQLAYEKNRITYKQCEELTELAKVSVDMDYKGNKYATAYDLDQDLLMAEHDISIIDLYEMVLVSATATQQAKMVMGRSIAGSYARLIIRGLRTFESVPEPMKQETADKLIEEGRYDLITDIDYLPVEYMVLTLISGHFTIQDVPEEHKQEVGNELIKLGHSDLLGDALDTPSIDIPLTETP